MGSTKLKLLKILDIIKDTDENNPITAMKISEKLRLDGIAAERKSICRDINALIDAGFDIKLCEDNKLGYFMVSREFEDWELKILIDAIWSAKFLSESDTRKIVKKLTALGSIESRKILKSTTTIKPYTKNTNNATKIYIDALLTAIKNRNKIKFQYTYTDETMQKKLKKEGLYYVVNPYSLVWKDQRYYLIGNHDKYNDLSYYRLDRITNLEITAEGVKNIKEILGDNAQLKLNDVVNASLYCYSGEKTTLRLLCKNGMEDEILDYFGNDAWIEKAENGFYTTLSVIESDGLIYWLMQHGCYVRVISPDSVKDRLVTFLEDTLEQYK